MLSGSSAQAADRAIRPKLRSPGHPKFQRHVEAAFWTEIAKGLLAKEAAVVVGVAQAVGARWFHHAGGMAPFELKQQPSGRYLSFAEREEIALYRAQAKGVGEIARVVGRDPGTARTAGPHHRFNKRGQAPHPGDWASFGGGGRLLRL